MAKKRGRSSSQKQVSARQDITDTFSDLKSEDVFLAFTGRGNTEKDVLVPQRPGFIYVRIPKTVVTGTLEEFSEAQAFSKDEHRHGVPVVVGKSRDNPSRYEVIDIWPVSMGEAVYQTAAAKVLPHARTHELFSDAGGYDPLMLDTMHLKTLQVTPTSPSSSSVVIGSGWYIWKDRAVHWYDGDEIDLAGSVPSGTFPFEQITVCSLWLEPDTKTIVNNTSTTLNNNNFDIQDHIQWPVEDYIPLAAVRLEAGVYQIGWSGNGIQNIIDMRPHQALMPGDMLPAGHPLDPDEGYHTGTLGADHVVYDDPYDIYASGTLDGILLENWMWSYLRMRTVTGDVDVHPVREVRVSSGTLSDLGDGVVQLQTGGGGGGGDVVVTKTTLYVRQEIFDETLLAAGRFDTDGTDLSGYEHLEFALSNVETDAAATNDQLRCYFNNDSTAANYRSSFHRYSDASHSVGGGDSARCAIVPAATAAGTPIGNVTGFIQNYAGATYKTVHTSSLARFATEMEEWFHAVEWESTNAITRIQIQPDGYAGDEIVAGARLQIWGWKTLDVVTDVTGGGGGTGTFRELQEDDVTVLRDGQYINFEDDDSFIRLDVIDEGGGKGTISGAFDESYLERGWVPRPDFLDISAGAADAGKAIKLDAEGLLPASMTHLNVEEQDGAPSVDNVIQIKVTNTTLTDEGGGVVSIDTGGGAGADDNALYVAWRGTII